MLAVDYMLTKPEGVTSLILASPALSVRRWAEDADRLLAQLPEDQRRIIKQHDTSGATDNPELEEALGEYYRRYFSRSDPWPPELHRAFEQLNTEVYELMWGPSELAATGTLKDYEREAEVHSLDLPVLFTTGRYDEATPETVEHYRRLVPGAEIAILENSAHMTMLDEPETYIDVVRDFLNKVDPGR
jgi:proline iminopeptidase